MSKDEKDNGKEFTFIKEQILPKKKSRLKKVCVSLGATLVLAVLFGVVARIAFIVSEPVISRLLGIDTNKRQVTFSSSTESSSGNNEDTSAVVKDEKEDTQELEPDPAVKPLDGEDQEDDDKDSDQNDSDTKTVNNNYYIEKKVAANINDFTTMYSDLKKIANKAFSSIVTITCIKESVDVLENPLETYTQTPGLVVGNNGVEFLILVSEDDVKDTETLEATFIGNVQVEAKLMEHDSNTGLAILSVPLDSLSSYVIDETVVANLGESYLLANGTPVLAIGSPNGVSNSFDFGIITNCTGIVYLTDLKLDLFYTSIVTSSDGMGYIINLDGSVVGIISNHFSKDSSNVCTVIGISRVKKLIEKMVNGKERAYIGLVTEDMPAEALLDAQISYGIYVSEVVAKSPAYTAGIQGGDIIVSINDSPVGGVNSFVSLLDNMEYKSEITVNIVRFNNGTPKNMDLTLTVGRVK